MIDSPVHPALINVRNAAEAALIANPDARIGFYSDDTTSPVTVALGIALRGVCSFTMTIAKSDYDGVKLAHLLGFPDALPEAKILKFEPKKHARRKR